ANGSGDPGLVPSAVVRQGFLELSNSNPVSEMTHMISAMRMFEMNQRVVQSQDERMGRTITELSPQG
ncbi:MAG: flagellar biosynthesis protein FlgC, partial [Verrucomicrobia bacterium]|nr:flagellar biosynthesis protein FlgC [Verrucomicrobiota bacterium]